MIIVTGANGFIGSALIWHLNQKGIDDIIAVDTVCPKDRPSPLKKRHYKKFLGKNELFDFLENSTEFGRARAETSWIIHLGACSSTTETNWEFLYENNTQYSQKIAQWCKTHSVGFIYASSAATYGDGQMGFDDQTDSQLLKPLNLYGESKVQFDRWLLEQSQRPPQWYGLKFFNVYGPNEYHKGEQSSVVYKAYQQIQKTNKLNLFKSYRPEYKDGMQLRDFVYVKDVIRWIFELMQIQPKSGIYNLGFGKARSWVDLANSTFSSMNRPSNIEFIDMPNDIRSHYQYFTEAKMDKWLETGLSKPEWSLEQGVQDYIQNYLTKEDQHL